jgi:hypothetical protein
MMAMGMMAEGAPDSRCRNARNISILICDRLFRDDDFDPADDEDEVEYQDADETQEGEDTELLDENDGVR